MTDITGKFCLKWQDFQQNIVSSYQDLRKASDFSDVTLVSGENQPIEAHKIILAAFSPFFKYFLRHTKNSHTMIYMRGLKSKALVAIVDFIYHGEANVYQEDLEEFLKLAQELQLEGLSGPGSEINGDKNMPSPIIQKIEEKNKNYSIVKHEKTPVKKDNNEITKYSKEDEDKPILDNSSLVSDVGDNMPASTNLAIKDHIAQMASMMEKIHDGKYRLKCKVCGKINKGNAKDMRRHIEIHIEDLSYPCNQCEKVCRSSNCMNTHKQNLHKNNLYY